jgi:hypothetical protein
VKPGQFISSPVKRLLLQNTKRGGQGPNWAVEPYDDDGQFVKVIELYIITANEIRFSRRRAEYTKSDKKRNTEIL